jgi:hypothetical protein
MGSSKEIEQHWNNLRDEFDEKQRVDLNKNRKIRTEPKLIHLVRKMDQYETR